MGNESQKRQKTDGEIANLKLKLENQTTELQKKDDEIAALKNHIQKEKERLEERFPHKVRLYLSRECVVYEGIVNRKFEPHGHGKETHKLGDGKTLILRGRYENGKQVGRYKVEIFEGETTLFGYINYTNNIKDLNDIIQSLEVQSYDHKIKQNDPSQPEEQLLPQNSKFRYVVFKL